MRTFREIAKEIKEKWTNKNTYSYLISKPYIDAMLCLDTTDPHATYWYENAKEQVLRFLSNATGWRGEDAKRIKAELKEMIK